MHIRDLLESKYVKWGLTATCVILLAVVVYFFILRAGAVSEGIRILIGILTPFFYGFVMAYLLRPVFNKVQREIYTRARPSMKKELSAQRLSKAMAATASIALLLFLLVGTLSVVLPQLVSSIYTIIVRAPATFNDLYHWMDDLPFLSQEIKTIMEAGVEHFENTALDWVKETILPNMSEIVTEVSTGVIEAVSVVMNFIIGIIICVYILYSKVRFSAQAKKAVYAFCSKETANDILDAFRFVDKVFNGYVVGKIIDSFVVGLVCFGVMMLFSWPYATLISVLVGVTNIIPFFGPFIGAIPSAILIFTVNPMQALYFIIFILILQQVEGNIIAPKILGDSTGLSSFWVMFAILIGGGLFGFGGMVIGVPIFAVFYAFVSSWIRKRLAQRDLPPETEAYEHLYHIDPQSEAFITLQQQKEKEEEERARQQGDQPPKKKRRLLKRF